MKHLFTLLILFVFSFYTLSAQNCGNIIDFRATIIDNQDGTETCTFEIDIEATSGGSKSVKVISLSCPNNVFVENQCYESLATIRTVTFGPFTRPTCTGSVILNWSGHTNANCGGTTCQLQGLSLPVELVSFLSNVKGGSVELSWITDSEINNAGFEIQKSIDGISWEKIGWVEGAGTTNARQHYVYHDQHPHSGNNYYRLKQVDFDGKFEYSGISSSVILNREESLKLSPNPANNYFKIKGASNDETGVYEVIDELGVVVSEGRLTAQEINITSLKKGMYYVRIWQSNQFSMKKLIKQ